MATLAEYREDLKTPYFRTLYTTNDREQAEKDQANYLADIKLARVAAEGK